LQDLTAPLEILSASATVRRLMPSLPASLTTFDRPLGK
jgi:hypothetical protein